MRRNSRQLLGVFLCTEALGDGWAVVCVAGYTVTVVAMVESSSGMWPAEVGVVCLLSPSTLRGLGLSYKMMGDGCRPFRLPRARADVRPHAFPKAAPGEKTAKRMQAIKGTAPLATMNATSC